MQMLENLESRRMLSAAVVAHLDVPPTAPSNVLAKLVKVSGVKKVQITLTTRIISSL